MHAYLAVAAAAAAAADSVPTLVLSECVLIYLQTAAADAVVRWAASFFERSLFLCYEQIRPDDAFGQTMLQNLQVGRAWTEPVRRASRPTTRGPEARQPPA